MHSHSIKKGMSNIRRTLENYISLMSSTASKLTEVTTENKTMIGGYIR